MKPYDGENAELAVLIYAYIVSRKEKKKYHQDTEQGRIEHDSFMYIIMSLLSLYINTFLIRPLNEQA